jgi:myo-inositol 2-dehydrogenase / D-chiro-inositol 1-dehydrogenase
VTQGKEIRSKAHIWDPLFNYLLDSDRHLLAKEKPQYRFNIIGTGINGQEHIRVTHLEGRAAVHGIYDPNPGSVDGARRAHAQYCRDADLKIYDSLQAACSDPAVDGLIICTPNYTHLDVVKVAAQSGKHILLEKPIATTLEDALEITRMAESYPAVFQIGLQYRYKSMYVEAIHEALERQTIGDIKLVSIQEHRIPFLDKVNQWNKFSKFSGDTLVEKCCHYFDLLNLFARSKPVSVYASGGMAVNFRDFEYNGEKSDILDSAMVVVNYENGARANFNLCMFAPMFYEELILFGDEGRLKAWEQQDYQADLELETMLEITCGEEKPSRKTKLGYPARIERSGHGGATFYEHVNFVNRISGQASNAATAREGLWAVIVALAAQQSITAGQVILIDDLLAGVEV